MRLTPDPSNEMYGRTSFLIHGDTGAHNHGASEGCIIFNLCVRQQIATSSKTRHLQVIPGSTETPVLS